MRPAQLRCAASIRRRSTAATVTLLLGLLTLLAACGGGPNPNHDADPFNDDSAKEGTVKLHDRPSMETILQQYRAFQADLFAQLAKSFGPRHWTPIDGDDGILAAGCNDDLPEDWSVVWLPTVGFDGTYPRADWPRVRDLVVEVGKKHGFTEVVTVYDMPTALDFVAYDTRYGGRYDFGMGNNTSIVIETGCHHWDKLPPPPTAP